VLSEVGPEPALVVGSGALSCDAGGLAGDSGDDGIDVSDPGLGVEGGEVRPNRTPAKVPFFNAACKDLDDRDFPFDVADLNRLDTSSGESELPSEIETTFSGAHREDSHPAGT